MRLACRSHSAPRIASSAASPITSDCSHRTGYNTVRSILDPGSAAQPPAVLHPSSSATLPTLLMPDQPRTAIIMVCQAGVDGDRGLSAACTARELTVLSVLPPANWSPSVACAERIRRALPCGKAFTGCRAPLRTSRWTRSVLDQHRCARSNTETADGYQIMCPLHWIRPGTRAGQYRPLAEQQCDRRLCVTASHVTFCPSAAVNAR